MQQTALSLWWDELTLIPTSQRVDTTGNKLCLTQGNNEEVGVVVTLSPLSDSSVAADEDTKHRFLINFANN